MMHYKVLIIGIGIFLSGCSSPPPLYEPSIFAIEFDPGGIIEAIFDMVSAKSPDDITETDFSFDMYNGSSVFVKTFHYVQQSETTSISTFSTSLKKITLDALTNSKLKQNKHPNEPLGIAFTGKNITNNDIAIFYESDTVSGSVKFFITPTNTNTFRVIGVIVEHPKIQ